MPIRFEVIDTACHFAMDKRYAIDRDYANVEMFSRAPIRHASFRHILLLRQPADAAMLMLMHGYVAIIFRHAIEPHFTPAKILRADTLRQFTLYEVSVAYHVS